ncbi:hypothetical protein TUM19329_29630 [Legionella antarctica]|uniref:Major outer membrane protein n=1 Tax=Legionella antarctica TaxID=2708020 RepID=A0A6F8T973_9GAMM|nr:Lpg1974 family pore-forming outer membrane protein [Legionella antarctica]BCA96602.1 hypothetical protein TUM19329_29630 [Legionella antarctica]
MNNISNLNQLVITSLFLLNSGALCAGSMGDFSLPEEKSYFFSATALYGLLSDSSINSLQYAETISVNGGIVDHTLNLDSRWGYSLSLGYKFGPQKSNDLVLSYTNLKNKGSSSVTNTNEGDFFRTNVGLIVGAFDNTATLVGPATAFASNSFEFQSAELLTHGNYQSAFAHQLRLAKFYGIKATEIKKGFNSQYSGIGVIDTPDSPVTDFINYQAKYYGVGPKFGGGAYWDINSFLSIGGDLSLAILSGSAKSQWNETLTTEAGEIFSLPPSTVYSYNKSVPSALWVSPVLGANLVVTANFNMNNDSHLSIEGGVGSEQYWSDFRAQQYGREDGANTVNINQRLALRTVFVKATYFA